MQVLRPTFGYFNWLRWNYFEYAQLFKVLLKSLELFCICLKWMDVSLGIMDVCKCMMDLVFKTVLNSACGCQYFPTVRLNRHLPLAT